MATYDYLKSKNGHKIQVESAKRDGAGKNIENNYAKQNGYYAQLTAGLADNLTPYSEDSGDLQENPFISNGTGTNNNQKIVTVGDYALVQEKQGNTVCVNQYVQAINSTNWNTVNGSATYSNGVATFLATAYRGMIRCGKTLPIQANHTILIRVDIKCSSVGGARLYAYGGYITQANTKANEWETIYLVKTTSSSWGSDLTNNNVLAVEDMRQSAWDNIEVKNAKCFDLTQWGFTADQIADITANPSHFFWYYNGSLAYNTGSLESANGVKLVSTGRNIYNPDETYNVVIPNKPFFVSKTTTITYYDKDKNSIGTESVSAGNTFTTPSNCVFINSSVSSITITPYYTDQEGGESYKDINDTPIEYPYEEPTVVDTGSELLLSAGSARDYKEPSGVIHRLVGTIDLGTLNYTKSGTSPNIYFIASITGLKKTTANTDLLNVSCSKYTAIRQSVWYTGDKVIFGLTNESTIAIKDTAYNDSDAATFKTAMSGVMLYYELATPTTEQGTPYPETLPINDYGMLYWLDSNDKLVGIPQGAKIFFPVNYKGLLDDIYSRTSGDAENLVIQSELSASETARDTVDTQLLNAIGGTLRQCLCVKESLDFDNTAFVDLGTLTWTYRSSDGVFSLPANTLPTLKSNGKVLCTLYNQHNVAVSSMLNMEISTEEVYNTHDLIVKNTSYTNANTFKNAMKGVLLAYEKA